MADTDKLNIDSIIARLLEGKWSGISVYTTKFSFNGGCEDMKITHLSDRVSPIRLLQHM